MSSKVLEDACKAYNASNIVELLEMVDSEIANIISKNYDVIEKLGYENLLAMPK